jgi:hypothetical protein
MCSTHTLRFGHCRGCRHYGCNRMAHIYPGDPSHKVVSFHFTSYHMVAFSYSYGYYRSSEGTERWIQVLWETALPPTLCVIVNTVLIEAGSLQYTYVSVPLCQPVLFAFPANFSVPSFVPAGTLHLTRSCPSCMPFRSCTPSTWVTKYARDVHVDHQTQCPLHHRPISVLHNQLISDVCRTTTPSQST